MKTRLIMRAVLAAVLSLVATTATAHSFEFNGIYYNYDVDNTVSVTYQGSSHDEYANEYTGDVVIPSSVTYSGITYSVTSIGDYAFYNCSGLTSVTIPNSVTKLNNSAFRGCSGLTSVTIPNTVTSIESSVFDGCSGLTSVTIPNSITLINAYTFNDCSGLTSVTIPNSVTKIVNSAFLGCSGLKRVDISSLEAWLGIKFYDTSSNPLCYAHHLYLNGEEVKDLDIPNSVTSIGNYAFEGCSGLTSVTIPNSVTSIGENAFYECSGLTRVDISSIEAWLGIKFEDYHSNPLCYAHHLYLNGEEVKDLDIPNSVSSIGNYAFRDCSGLTSVTIPNSVTSIGDYAFWNCSGLTSVTIPNSVASIGEWAFNGCNGLTRVDISSIETWLGIKFSTGSSNPLYYAHHLYINGEEVKDLVIPNSVTSIGDYVFSGCSGLTSVSIPNSVTEIGNNAFMYCSGLTSVSIPNSVTEIGNKAFMYCSGLTSVSIPNSVTEIGNYAFDDCSGLTSVTIPNSVTEIGYYAFSGCSGLTSITIPNSVTSIGDLAFSRCSGLTSVTIPNSVNSIGNYAFEDCSGLTSITIPNSVTSIGDYAFQGCEGLKTIFYNAENCADVNADSYVFNIYSYYLNIIIGKDVKKVPNYLFNSLSKLARVISQSVTPPTCSANTFKSDAYTAKLYVPSEAEGDYYLADVWDQFNIATVDKPITAIALNESEATIALGSTKQLTATTTPSDATIADIFEWSSSNPEVAVVDGNGLVTAVGEGTTVITAKAFDGSEVTGTCNITVRSFNATSITLNVTELNMFEKDYTTLTYAILPEDATVKTAEWSVSDSNVLTYKVMSDGSLRIVAKSAGTAAVTARTTDGSNLSATCVVTVYPVATNVNQIKPGTNKVKFALQGVKMHNGVLYACTTTESVNKSTPTLHGNDANNMAPYEDRNFADFDQRDWVAIRGLEGDFEGKELSYPFVATFADGVLTPSETLSATADATAYNLNTFRAENILHGGYSNYAEGDYKAYYVPARENEVAKFMGLIETIGGVKYLYSNNAYGRTDGQGIKVENCTIADNSKVYSILEGILVADKSTKAGVKIIMLKDLGQATGVEGVDAAAARIYSANGNIIIAAAEDGEAAVYDFTGRLVKSVPVVAGDNTAVPVMPGCYIVRTGVNTQSVVVK